MRFIILILVYFLIAFAKSQLADVDYTGDETGHTAHGTFEHERLNHPGLTDATGRIAISAGGAARPANANFAA
ncbi:unnamed protein product [Cylicocyclus nassatus]|uniref:Uncharacterized protein n=1 Tax=Cylicocyclus nassatus TaxID=53992 RepID=A0AA36DQ36_CYLNA|nr:unnamed protein product [Cylicocyclus nassatus]